jgi:hypothetical protein
VQALFNLVRIFVRTDLAELRKSNVRIRVIGERDGLPPDILALLREAESETAGNNGLQFDRGLQLRPRVTNSSVPLGSSPDASTKGSSLRRQSTRTCSSRRWTLRAYPILT